MSQAARAYREHAAPDAEALLKKYMPLVRYHAEDLMRRLPQQVEIEDLVQAGVVGLLEAAGRYDPAREAQFATFVGYRIRGAMLDFLRAHDWMPRTLRGAAKDIQEAIRILEQRYGRPATEEEIAAELGISVDEYRKRLEQVRAMSVVSFEDLKLRRDDDDPVQLAELIAADAFDGPEAQVMVGEFMEQLAQAIAALPPRERVLITLYYYEELSMKEIALILGVTESRVSQLHTQMVIRLRTQLGLDA